MAQSINLNEGIRFSPRTNHRALLLFYLFASFFLIVGIAGLFMALEQHRFFAWFVTGFSSFLLFMIWTQSTAKWSFYHVGREGIFIKRMYFKELFPFEKIEEVILIGEKEAEALLDGRLRKTAEEVVTGDISNAFKAQIDMGKLIKYCTVPFVFSKTGGGLNKPGTSDTSGEFVLLILTEGRMHLISPVENKKFIFTFNQYKAKNNF